jgi:hypothetical protein
MRDIILAPGPPSWTFSNPKVGRLIQHYERGTNIWANGELDPNIRFDACESEGVAGEPLTDSQVENLIDLAKWYVKEEDWSGFKRLVQAFEHKEMTRFGAPPTACPSDRIPWQIIIPAVEEEPDMPDLEVRNRMTIEGILLEAAAWAVQGKPWPDRLKEKVNAVARLAAFGEPR